MNVNAIHFAFKQATLQGNQPGREESYATEINLYTSQRVLEKPQCCAQVNILSQPLKGIPHNIFKEQFLTIMEFNHLINTWLVDTAALAGFPNVEVRPHRIFGRLQLPASYSWCRLGGFLLPGCTGE